MQEKVAGIYMIQHISSGKKYVGRSKRIITRFSQHRVSLRRGVHFNKYLQHAWTKYGESDFLFKVIEYLESNDTVLEERENYWIDYYESTDLEKGYNFQSGTQGTFTAAWHQIERSRKIQKCKDKDYNYFTVKKYLSGITEEDKNKIITNLIKCSKTHFLQCDRISENKLKIKMTEFISKDFRYVYILLNPYKVVTKEEFDIPVQTPLGNIFQIKPDSSEVIKTFLSPKEIRDTYPQVNESALERILYGKEGHRSTKGLIFVPEKEYDPNELYTIRKKTNTVLQIDKDKNIIKRYASVKHVLKEHNLNEGSLRTALCKSLPTLQYPFVYEGNLETAKFGAGLPNTPKVKLIVINGDSETEYLSVADFVTQYPEYKRKAIEKVLYEGKKHYKGLKFKTVKYS